jgi:hypothetical protein
MHEWHFRLEGDEFDIQSVTELFQSEVKMITDGRMTIFRSGRLAKQNCKLS